jgi:hypothetical protein
VKLRSLAGTLGGALAGAALFACASAGAPGAASPGPPCAGLTPPRRLTTAAVPLPASFVAVRVGGIVVYEAVIAKDGAVSGLRLVGEQLEALLPFAAKSVEGSAFAPASIEGNPVATRVQIATTIGTVGKPRVEPEYDLLRAHVPGGVSREALWQLAGSVERLTLIAHVGTPAPAGAEIAAIAPAGAERVLVKLPASARPVDARETVSAGKFFSKAGDYRLELRAGGKTLAWTTLTIADDYTRAIVNACEPI